MCKKEYAPLHNHSHYSTLDGYSTIEEYVQVATEMGFKGIGLTDHGTASGIYKFVNQVKEAGLIPVPGIEFYVAPENPKGAKAKTPIYYGKDGKKEKYDVSKGAYTHLTVFAYNNVGLSNLFKLTSLSFLKEHFYHNPRIDTNMLAEYSEGLIVTTGCPSSEVSRRFLLGQDDKAYEYANRLKSIFGENLYVEIMDHKMKNEELERILVPKQIKLAKDLGLKIIATNDSHYSFKSDAEAHERILALNAKSKMSEKTREEGGKRWAFSGPEYYIKSYEEMLSVYPKEIAEEALANTLEIVEKCKDIKFEYNAHLRPFIEIPEGYSEATYLQKLIYDGFVKKRGHQSKEIQAESVKRIKEEFQVLHSNDFISYFLVVNDYIGYAHKNGIGVGAGRGSVGGSEIAYVLDISNTDPIRFDLLFERFLSPGRGSLYEITYTNGVKEEIAVSSKKMVYNQNNKVVYVHELKQGDKVNYEKEVYEIADIYVKVPGSAPDVDTDFHTKGREDVVQYCINKYGEDKVANIVSFGTFKAKKAFKAMCTIYSVPFSISNKLSNMIPGNASEEPLLDELFDPSSKWYKEGGDFRAAVEGNEILEEVVRIGTQLKGRISEIGKHPCGVIISNQPLSEYAPTFMNHDTIKDPDTGQKIEESKVLTQWEYPELEELGFIKMDLLGLELIDTIQQAEENIILANQSTAEDKYKREKPDMRKLIDGPMDDEETYKVLQEGNTVSIFQLGSPGVRELLKMAKPSSFMEIANITALYRPGPMKSGAHIQYANRKNGVEEISYIHPDFHGTEVEEVLKETYGLMIFQEQIMLIAGRYAGFTPYETDKLRKAVGKKKIKLMMKMKPKFVEGCLKRGASEEATEILWETIRVFGEYGFNKSHSVSYAINIYQAVYLKAHFPAEFMAAAIQQGTGSPDKLRSYIQEAKRMKLKIGSVDINTSQVKMSSTGFGPNREFDIVYGFSGIKQINNQLSSAIVAERLKNGKYTSVANFVERILKTYNLGQATLGNLALAGAFDCFGVSRKLVKEKAKMIIDSTANKAKKGASLFDLMGGGQGVSETIQLKGEDFTYSEKIEEEAAVVGMFLSGHPTSRLGHIARNYNLTTFDKVLKSEGRATPQMVAGTITEMKSKLNKTGKRSIAVLIDDGESAHSVYLPKNIVDSIQKGEEIEKMEEEGYTPNEKIKDIMLDEEIKPIKPISTNKPYVFTVSRRGHGENAVIVVNKILHLNLAPDGSLPYEVIAKNQSELKAIQSLLKKHKAKDGFYLRIHTSSNSYIDEKVRFKLSVDFIREIEALIGKRQIITKSV